MFLKIISILGSLTFLSRILGYVRDLLIARIMGAGLVSDAFFISFKLPNLFRRLFAEGSMNAAFIPIVSGIKSKFGKKRSDEFFSLIFSSLIKLIICSILFIGNGFLRYFFSKYSILEICISLSFGNESLCLNIDNRFSIENFSDKNLAVINIKFPSKVLVRLSLGKLISFIFLFFNSRTTLLTRFLFDVTNAMLFFVFLKV